MKTAVVLGEDRFTDLHAKRYVRLYREKGAAEAKKWAMEFLAPGPRERMTARVNQMKGFKS